MIYKRFCNQVEGQISHIYILGSQGGLGGLKLGEIDAANSFLMLPMAWNGLKRPVKISQKPIKIKMIGGSPAKRIQKLTTDAKKNVNGQPKVIIMKKKKKRFRVLMSR